MPIFLCENFKSGHSVLRGPREPKQKIVHHALRCCVIAEVLIKSPYQHLTSPPLKKHSVIDQDLQTNIIQDKANFSFESALLKWGIHLLIGILS